MLDRLRTTGLAPSQDTPEELELLHLLMRSRINGLEPRASPRQRTVKILERRSVSSSSRLFLPSNGRTGKSSVRPWKMLHYLTSSINSSKQEDRSQWELVPRLLLRTSLIATQAKEPHQPCPNQETKLNLLRKLTKALNMNWFKSLWLPRLKKNLRSI